MSDQLALVDSATTVRRAASARHPAPPSEAKLLEHFDAIVSSQNGVEKVRGLILHLAVQGRLLLERPRPPEQTPATHELAIPFGLPDGWTWRRVEEVGDLKLGRQRSPKNHTGAHMRPYLRVANVHEARINTSDVLEMNFEPEEAERFLLEVDDVLLNEGQSYELVGRPAVYRGEVPGACFQNTLIRFRPAALVLSEFALVVFRAYMRTGRFRREAQQTTNIAHLSLGRLAAIEFPLPPLAEQKRIVAKVDQLMALCDELDSRQTKKRETCTRLTKSALDALITADSPEAFDRAWVRVSENFDVLVGDASRIPEIRSHIVELAMRGRLTSSRPSDGQTGMALDPLPETEHPFSIPDAWRWVRWGQVTSYTSSGWSPQCENRPRRDHEWGVLKVSAVSWFAFKPEENKALPVGVSPRTDLAVREGDFLMSRANTADLVGRSVVAGKTPERLIISDKIVKCAFSEHVDKEFVNLYNRTSAARRHYRKHASGTSDSMKNISRAVILSMPIPLPPLAEQKRIVAKVSDLMKISDDLEATMRRSELLATKVADKLVTDARGLNS